MTTTSSQPAPVTHGESAARPVRMPTPGAAANRNRRRPILVLAAVLLLAVSALAGAFAFSQVSTTVSVVAMARTVPAGQQLQRDDLTVVQVTQTSGLDVVGADQLPEIVGLRAVTDLPAGSTLTPDSYADHLVPAEGEAVVGVLAAPGSAPLDGLVAGAQVLLVPLPDKNGGEATGAEVPGRVVAVQPLADGTGSRVDVLVAADQAARIQRLAAVERIALVILTKER